MPCRLFVYCGLFIKEKLLFVKWKTGQYQKLCTSSMGKENRLTLYIRNLLYG